MDAICYFCNKRSTDWCRNFAEIKSRHTQTPIADFIRQFLGNFHSTRNIDDKSNYICTECLEQIDDYDWLKQQASEHESKLRALLLATETKMCKKIAPNAVEYPDLIGSIDAFMDILNADDIKVEDDTDATETRNEQQSMPISPLSLPPAAVPPQAPILSTLCGDTTSNLVQILNGVKDIVSQTDKDTQASTAAIKTTTVIRSKASESSVDTTQSATSPHRDTSANVTTVLEYPEPAISITYLIALALKNSRSGSLLVIEIYDFLREHFPYFQTASEDWKRTIRRNLSTSKCFEKIECKASGNTFKMKYLWKMNPSKINEIDITLQIIASNENSTSIHNAMAVPENLPTLLRGEMKHGGLYEFKTPSSGFKKAEPEYSKPILPYACLIALAMKNSHCGALLIPEIYNFVREHFPYFKSASEDWKSSIRSTLLKNECFDRIEHKNSVNPNFKSMWKMNPLKISEMDETLKLQSDKIVTTTHKIMALPEHLPALLRGEMKHGILNEKIIGLGITNTDDLEPETECENGAVSTKTGGDEYIVAEFLDDAPDVFDTVDIDDSELLHYTPNSDGSQTDFVDNDFQPMEKRARLDVE